jgi:hypothetical protein
MHRTIKPTVSKRPTRRPRRLSEEDVVEIAIGGPVEPDATTQR